MNRYLRGTGYTSEVPERTLKCQFSGAPHSAWTTTQMRYVPFGAWPERSDVRSPDRPCAA